MALDLPTLKNFVENRLGLRKLRIELAEEDFDDISTDALELYGFRLPRQGLITTAAVTKDTKKVDLSGVTPKVLEVEKLGFNAPNPIVSNSDVFKLDIYSLFFGGGREGRVIDTQTLPHALMWLEMQTRILGGEVDFEYFRATKTLMLTNVPTDASSMTVMYYSTPLIGDVPEEDELIVKKLALAFGKLYLGRNRKKFENVPVPSGGVLMDGETLKHEGKEEVEKWEKFLLESDVMPPVSSG